MMWLCEKTKRKKYLRCPVCKACEIIDLGREAPSTCRCGTDFDGETESTWVSDLMKACAYNPGRVGRYYG